MAPIKLTHDETIDALVKRLQGKHERVVANRRYYDPKGRCIGEMDVATLDWHNNKIHIHYYEIKTGHYKQARKDAKIQASHFFGRYLRSLYEPTFIFYHPDHGFERWKR